MKRIVPFTVLSLLFSSVALADPPAPSVAPKPVTTVPVAPLPTLRVPPPALVCPDPAAVSIDYSMVSRASRFAGRVRIAGKVKNVGGAAYVSGPNQQVAQLYEIVPGGRPRLVASQAFQNLAPNAEVTVSFERDWNASSPAEGEFPPSYRLMIVDDPDILLDGNPRNDDCGRTNNTRDRAGSDINAMFR
jgi:hypothetical protein